MKNRFLTVILALALCLGLAIPAFAATSGEAAPVTVNDIILSSVVISDKYEAFSDEAAAPDGCYNLGLIGLWDGEQYNYVPLNCYIIPDDAVITFDTTEHKKPEVLFYTLEDVTEPSASCKSYEATNSGHVSQEAGSSQKSLTITKGNIEALSESGVVSGYDVLYCSLGGNYVGIMFESKTDVLGEPIQPAPSFTDLLPWCTNEAVWAAQQKITNGYGSNDKFAPGVDCTQAQILTFLWRAENKPEAAAAPITVAASYQGAVNWAYEKGMIDDSFNPDAPCTRSQAVSYIWQAKGTPEAAEAASFSDIDAGASYIDAVSWAVEKKVTNGYGGNDTFAPDRVCSRGEIVCFLYRAYNS